MSEKQKVSLQYSIDLDDLPKEVIRLIGKANDILVNKSDGSLNELLPTNDDEVLSLKTIQQIEALREKFSDVDHVLNDVVNIINGYITYKIQETAARVQESNVDRNSQPPEEELIRQSEPFATPPNMPTFDPSTFLPEDLAQKLEEFKKVTDREKPNQTTK